MKSLEEVEGTRHAHSFYFEDLGIVLRILKPFITNHVRNCSKTFCSIAHCSCMVCSPFRACVSDQINAEVLFGQSIMSAHAESEDSSKERWDINKEEAGRGLHKDLVEQHLAAAGHLTANQVCTLAFFAGKAGVTEVSELGLEPDSWSGQASVVLRMGDACIN
eukprot:1228712-Amphidinium_carterae.1